MSGTFTLVGKLLRHDKVTPHVDSPISVLAALYPDTGDHVTYTLGAAVLTDADGSFSVALLTETSLVYTVVSDAVPALFEPIAFTAPAAGSTIHLDALTSYAPTTVTPSVLADAIAARDAAVAAAAAAATFDPTSYTLRSSSAIDATRAPYSASGANTGDQTSAIQSAINAANAVTSGGLTEVLLPAGTFLFSGKIQVKSHVRLRGAGLGMTILKSSAGAGSNTLVEVIADVDAEVTDLTLDCNSRTTSVGVLTAPTSGTGTRIAVRRCRIINGVKDAIRFTGIGAGWTIEDCTIDSCGQGTFMYAPSSGVTKDLRIERNTYINVGGNNLQVGNNTVNHTIAGVICRGNILRDFAPTGTNGPIPIEITWCDDVAISNNFIGAGGTRGISTGQNYDMTVTGNVVRGQSLYAVESAGNVRFSITGNTFVDCAQFFVGDGTTPNLDGVFAGNACVGTGLTSTLTGGDGVKLGDGARRMRVSDNVFSDWQYLRAAVRIGESSLAEDVVVEGNTFIINDANTPALTVAVRKAIRSAVVRNTVRVKRNLLAADDITDVIQVVLDAASSDITVADNEILYSGTIGTSDGSQAGIGHGSTSSATMPGLVVRRNRVKGGARGLRLFSLTSADAIVDGNDTRTCTNADQLHANTVIRSTVRQVDGTTAPAAGAWLRGDICWNNGSTNGGTLGWICTTAGSPGTWTAIPISYAGAGADADLKVSSVAPELATTAFVPTAGVAYVARCRANQGGASTTLKLSVIAAGVTVANAFVAVYDSTGARLGVSADISTSLQSTGEKTLTISSVALAAGQVYYLLVVFGSAGTVPQFRGPASGGLFGVNGINRCNSYLTGLTAAPASLTLGSLVSVAAPFPWLALA